MKEVIDTVSVALANGDTENVGNVVMQEVNRTLLSAGVDEVWADKIDNLIVLLFIIGIALLANIICRKIILRVVAKLVKQTKATWDDIVFNHKVMVNVSRMVAPILIYIAIPIAFPEQADLFARFSAASLSDIYHCCFSSFHQRFVYGCLSSLQ